MASSDPAPADTRPPGQRRYEQWCRDSGSPPSCWTDLLPDTQDSWTRLADREARYAQVQDAA